MNLLKAAKSASEFLKNEPSSIICPSFSGRGIALLAGFSEGTAGNFFMFEEVSKKFQMLSWLFFSVTDAISC